MPPPAPQRRPRANIRDACPSLHASLRFLLAFFVLFISVIVMSHVGGVRAPSLISRAWLTPASLAHHLPIRKGMEPQYLRTRNFHASSRASASTSSAIPHISLHIAASASGKRRKFQPELDTYEFDPTTQDSIGVQSGRNHQEIRKSRPHSGEDAFFVAKVGRQANNITAFAILDGVGGWAGHGIDPADFSHGLSSHMAKVALEWQRDKLSPQKLLEIGYKRTIDDPTISAGGTTACVAVAGKEGRMHIANLGDSGFLQLRLGAVHHYSNPQTHAFNTPYQMSITPPHILAQAEVFGGMPLNDAPEKADFADHMLRHGDVLVLATDGVWDNLNSQEVLNIVSSEMRTRGAWLKTEDRGFVVTDQIGVLTKPGHLQDRKQAFTLQGAIAAAIVAEAKSAAHNEKRDGPFAKETQKFFPGEAYHGGKVDDISVLVVIPVDPSRIEEKLKAKL